MEKPLRLRKPSTKPLLVLLNIAEQLLFSFPVSPDLIKKYEAMRTKVFTSLKLKSNPLPIASIIDHENMPATGLQTQNATDYTFNILRLELLSLLQKSQNITESYLQELRFSSSILGNIFNNLTDLIGIGEKLELSPRNISNQDITPEINSEYQENDTEEEIDRFKEKIRLKNVKLKELRNELKKREKTIVESIKIIEKKYINDINALKKQYLDEKTLIKNNEITCNETINKLNKRIEELSQEKINDQLLYNEKIDSLLLNIQELKDNEINEKPKNIDMNDVRLAEIIELKEKYTKLEVNLSKKENDLLNISENHKNLNEKKNKLEQRINELNSYLKNLEFENQELKIELEHERSSFEYKQVSLKKEINNRELEIQQSNEEYIYKLQKNHEQNIESTKLSYTKEINYLKEEIYNLKSQISSLEDSNNKMIKSLQFELLKEKNTQSEIFLSDTGDNYKSESENLKYLEKIERKLNDSLNIMGYINELLFPVYESYASLQKD